MDSATRPAEIRGIVYKVKRGEPEALRKAFLSYIEALGEVSVLRRLIDARPQAVDGTTKQKGCSSIQSEIKEEWLQVDVAILGHASDEVVDMLAEVVKILVLSADKLLPKELPGMLPCGTFLREDAITKERCKH